MSIAFIIINMYIIFSSLQYNSIYITLVTDTGVELFIPIMEKRKLWHREANYW